MKTLALILAGLFCCSPVIYAGVIEGTPQAESIHLVKGEKPLSHTRHVTPALPVGEMLENQAAKGAVTTVAISKEAERRFSH